MKDETLPNNDMPEIEPEPQPEPVEIEDTLETPDEEVISPPEPPDEEAVTPEAPVEEPAPPQEPGRMQVFFSRLLRWAVFGGVFLLAGVLVTYFFLYRPAAQSLADTRGRLDAAVQQVDDLKGRLQAAETTVTGLKSENDTLKADLDAANDHLSLIQVLVDVSTARLSLVFEDVPGAKLALTDTSSHLEKLVERIAGYDANLASSMPQRLSLILSGLESDPKTAEIDLELLTKNLLDVEKALFGD